MSTLAVTLAPPRSRVAARVTFQVACVVVGTFLFWAALVGWLSRRGWDRTIRSSIGAMLLGSMAIYAIGVSWLMAAVDLTVRQALQLGLYPFIIGDTVKLMVAAGLLPAAWGLLQRFRPDEEG